MKLPGYKDLGSVYTRPDPFGNATIPYGTVPFQFQTGPI